MTPPVLFATLVRTPAGKILAGLLIESLRAFGGEMSACPFWVFAADPGREPCRELAGPGLEVIPLEVPLALRAYPFGDKVAACARAEQLASAGTGSLAWLDLECLVVQPPGLYELGTDYDAALRPVHIRNVGLPAGEPPDTFWSGIYAALGIEDVALTVESFVDRQRLRAYFNSHGLTVNPARGLFQRWLALFERLVGDEVFQAAACRDGAHRIFLFQAVFSALAASELGEARVRILPPTYQYPYNLHGRVPPDRRAGTLDELVSLVFEGRSLRPGVVADLAIGEPLRAWLEAHAP
jgi:hypothetical protein